MGDGIEKTKEQAEKLAEGQPDPVKGGPAGPMEGEDNGSGAELREEDVTAGDALNDKAE